MKSRWASWRISSSEQAPPAPPPNPEFVRRSSHWAGVLCCIGGGGAAADGGGGGGGGSDTSLPLTTVDGTGPGGARGLHWWRAGTRGAWGRREVAAAASSQDVRAAMLNLLRMAVVVAVVEEAGEPTIIEILN